METFRSSLEVLKWCAPWDVLGQCSLVCRLWTRASDSEELWMTFAESVDLEEAQSEVRLSQKQRFHQCRKREFLPVLSAEALHLFSLYSERWCMRVLTQQCTIAPSSSWVFLASRLSFLCSGGGIDSAGPTQNLDSAFEVSLSGEVQQLGRLLKPRRWHGAAVHSAHCYAFGGTVTSAVFEFNTSTCERIRTSTLEQWEEAPDMLTPRSQFTPCLYAERIYLMGGMTKSCELFDTPSQSFYALPIEVLPYPSLTVVMSGQVVTITGKVETRLDLEEEEVHIQLWKRHLPCGNTTPIVKDRAAWVIVSMNGWRVLKLDFDALSIAEKSRIDED